MGRGPRRNTGAAAVSEAVPEPAEEWKEGGEEPEVKGKKKGLKRKGAPEEEEPLDTSKAAQRISDWIDDSKKQERWLASRGGGLADFLGDDSKMTVLRDFLPLDMADAVLKILENLPEDTWELSEQAGDADAASHRFWSADVCDVEAVAPLRSLFWKLLPKYKDEPTLPIFSCGRYGKGDFINKHDDSAHVPFNGSENIYSRTVAGVWHLTRDWGHKDGGTLLDQHGEEEVRHVPIYNSLVVFEVPRNHSVMPVLTDRYRYSIFGWWHQSGERYEKGSAAPTAKVAAAGKKRPLKKRKGKKEDAAAE